MEEAQPSQIKENKEPFLFINYRREDSEQYADFLYKDLIKEFIFDQIFFDKKNIDIGLPWPDEIKRHVELSTVMLVLIGENWLKIQDPKTGERKLNCPDDWVKKEIALAITFGIKIIPIYLDNSKPLMEDQLKSVPEICKLTEQQGLFLRRGDWDNDFEKIKQKLLENNIPLLAISQLDNTNDIIIPNIIGRNPNFSGRNDILKELHNTFESNHVQIITGTGGIGKSQLAIEYSYKYKESYKVRWWICAEDNSNIIQDLAALTDELKLQGFLGSDTYLKMKSAIKWLNKNNNWLLIFDNAEKPDKIKPFLPSNENGHILITSRWKSWKALGHVTLISEFVRKESVEFILKRTDLKETKESEILSEKLGDFPLALEQAGAYIENNEITIAEYLKLYELNKKEIINAAKPASGYPASLETTWDISLQKIKTEKDENENDKYENQLREQLLFFCAFLSPENIPIELIKKGIQSLNVERSLLIEDHKFNLIVKPLIQYSLVKRNLYTLSLHRCVQSVIRWKMEQEEREKWSAIVLDVIANSFRMRSDDPDTLDKEIWDECTNLLSHVLSAAKYSEILKVNLHLTSNLFAQAASFMREQSDLSKAKLYVQKAISIAKTIEPLDVIQCSICLENYARILRDLGEFETAMEYVLKAISIETENIGISSQHLAVCYDNLGRIYHEIGDFNNAMTYYKLALEIDKNILKTDFHPKIAIRLNNIAVTQISLNEYSKAKDNLEKSLKIEEKCYPDPNHPYLAIRYTTLGLLNQETGNLDEAIECYEKSCNIIQSFYGKDHPKMAEPLKNLGIIMAKSGNYNKAKTYFEDAINITESIYGQDFPSLKDYYINLGEVYIKLNDHDNAKKYFQKANYRKSIFQWMINVKS